MKFNIKPFSAFCLGFLLATVATVFAATHDIATWTGSGSRTNTVEFTIQSASPGAVASLLPGTANANSIGNTTYYVKDVISAKHGFAVSSSTTGVTPDYVGQMVFGSDKVVYIATAANATSWQKIGAQ